MCDEIKLNIGDDVYSIDVSAEYQCVTVHATIGDIEYRNLFYSEDPQYLNMDGAELIQALFDAGIIPHDKKKTS